MGKRTVIDSNIIYENGEAVVENSKKVKKPADKRKRKKRIIIVCVSLVLLLVAGYLTFAFGNFYPVRQLREIYIETAMTTDEHQWLATMFFPKSVIDKVMTGQVEDIDGINEADIRLDETEKDILGQKKLKVGDLDYAGNEILINDIEQGIVVSRVQGEGYVGKIMLIDDPSRVFLGVTDYWGTRGQFMVDLLASYDAIAGINASGFVDPQGHGSGGTTTSAFRIHGDDWGKYSYGQLTFGFNRDNKLVMGTIPINEWDDYNLRDCCQFGPALIVDGEQLVYESAGYGLHPRSIIGQRADGVVMLLIIDGRQLGYSIGATLGTCAEIMLDYKAVSAAACDGGSSAVMGYDGAIITTPSTSSLRSTGRYLPNAWLVRRK